MTTRCQECGFDWNCPSDDAIAAIDAIPARVAQVLHQSGVDNDDPRLRTRPAAAMWSPLEYVAHTADAIDWYAGRIVRVLTEHQPVLSAFDWDTHTASQRYHARALDEVHRALSSACAGCVDTLACLHTADWERAGTGSQGRPRTVLQLARRAAHEAQHHAHDIEHGIARLGRHRS